MAQLVSLEMNQRNMETEYNKKARPTVYKEGMLVWMPNDIRKIGECSKFRNEYLKTPFKIVKVIGTHNLKLQNTETGKVLKNEVHIDRVKHFTPREYELKVAKPAGASLVACTPQVTA